MKRFLSFTILLLALGFLMALLNRPRDQYRYSQLDLPEAEFQQIKAGRTETDRELLDGLTFDHYPAFIDKPSARRFYSVDPEAPDTDPAVGFSPTEKNVRIAFSGEIVPGSTIPFIAYTDSEYKAYSLAVTTLPLILIEEPEDYLTGIVKEDIHEIRFSLFDNRPDTHYPFIRSDGTIHIRGNGSRFYEKKNFRLTLTEKSTGGEVIENQTPLLGLRQDGDWLLYAAYNDQEKIRDVFSSNLWTASCGDDNSFGLQNGLEYRYVELFWNDRYCGLYALGYPIDAKQMGVQPDVTGHYDEFVFKQKHWGPKAEGYDPDYDGLILQHEAYQTDINNGIALTKMYFAMLENGADNGLWSNDADNAVDIWLYIKLIQGVDTVNTEGKMRNMFLTVKKSESGRKFLYTPWDMDISWGNRINPYNNITSPYVLDADDNSCEMTVNPVSILRDRDPEVVERIKERYAELRAGGWSEQTIDAMIDGYERDIYGSGAYVRDMERWPDGNYQDPEAGLSIFREYVHARLRSMDSYIGSLSVSEEN